MRKLLWLLMLLPTVANALCLDFYFDKDGQTHSIQCGSKRPELQCYGTTYWNGQTCAPIEIAKACESQGGKWAEVQLRGAQLEDVFKSGALAHKRSVIHMCDCPNQKVWDGKECRSDVPLNQQCTNFFGDGSIRMTKEFFGSEDCHPIPE